MDKYDTSQLTEFPRFEDESNQSGVTTFLNKLWKFPLFSPSESSDNLNVKSSNETKPANTLPEEKEREEYDLKTETASYASEYEGRSLPNVLKRISSLVALGSGGGTKYADTELARYWMPDDISRECYECAARFGTLRRRHHCRVCGQIFCSRCCSQRVPGQIFGCAGDLRVCTYCCNVVLSYLRENDMTGEISPDLRSLQESLQSKFPDNRVQSDQKNRDFMFSREHEPCDVRITIKEPLPYVFRQLSYGLPTQQHRYRRVKYNAVWRGCDILQWVMDHTSNKTRAQANCLCQKLLLYGYLERVTEPAQFADYALYRPAADAEPAPPPPTPHAPEAEECSRLVESVSSYCLDLNLGDSSARLTKATKREHKLPSSDDEQTPSEHNEPVSESEGVCAGSEAGSGSSGVAASGEEHLRLLTRQWLARAQLPAHWLHALYPLARAAAHCVRIDMMSSDIDVRNYVQVKKVPGGAVSDSCVINGVVMTKNVVHRGMPKHIANPTILLLDCSIAYQRVEGKLTSLEPLLMQEQEYLARCAARVAALRPHVVLVRGGVARAVQEFLRASGVALAVRVGARSLARVARCARADLVSSVDARIAAPRLGTADSFAVANYNSKTLMVLEGCAERNLGCCILLRGGTLQELIRVKKLTKFLVLACYNWKLEKAFLTDIEAILPEPDNFVDDEESKETDMTANDRINDKNLDENVDTEKNETEFNDSIFGVSNNTKSITDDNENTQDRRENLLMNTSKEDSESIKENESDTPLTNNTEINPNIKDKKNCKDNSEQISQNEKDIDDPLQKPRKTESNLSCGVPIRDFSDPLRSTMSLDDDVFLPKEEAVFKADTQNERWCSDDVVLSMSPNVVIPAPPRPLARAPPPAPPTPRALHPAPPQPSCSPQRTEAHRFIREPITAPADSPAVRAALADFRANGCRSVNAQHKPECPKYNISVIKNVAATEETNKQKEQEAVDPLSPEHHQQLSVLIYSYSSKSPNVPDFCVNPWIVTMEMYGKHDISLGAFLEKYCFNSEYKCPSTNCHVPMNQHVRRFVHGDASVTITCNTIGHSNVDKDKINEEQNKQVTFWSRCGVCGAGGRGAGVRGCALALSLAGYVRGRLHAPRYRRAACAHPLHAHAHAFVKGLTTAVFRYEKISMYDIQLPPDVIAINYDTKKMRDSLIAQLNELMQKGHETFSALAEAEAEKEYAQFRQHMELLHLALTAAPHHTARPGTVRHLWAVYDSIITGEKMLRDAQEKWSSPPAKGKTHPETTVEDKEPEDTIETTVSENTDLIKESEKDHTGTDEDEEKGDKKTVKQIIAQLLSNNHQSNQGSMIVSSGLIPVVVKAGEVGSVIAATLASATYQRSLHSLRHSLPAECEESDAVNMGKDKGDADKAKSKANEHIEVLLKDGLACRVYYAAQFRRLRHMLLAPLPAPDGDHPPRCCDDANTDNKGLCDIEEGFIRSLAHCVPWAARGGKSGSTFCKTTDDRYVLKEMTKPEWQQFLEFAPHYFNYVTNCRQKKLPSMLARILGVFSVGGVGGGAGVGVGGALVLEHVWYARAPDLRFDLKGAARARLARSAPDAVLLDENLLRLRWERQLYVRGGACAVVWAGLERDTHFLAAHAVMDYSLLLGIAGDTLVLGIIDYIRTFTWDKKLEHLVKKNLGSGQPTVVSPELYRRRFLAAARKYFLHAPHHWDHLCVPAVTR